MRSASVRGIGATKLLPLLALLFACDQEPRPQATSTSTEASPNASITPSPLLSASNLVPKLPKAAPKKVAVTVELPTPLPLQKPLAPDEEPNKPAPALLLSAKFTWPAFPQTLRLWGVDADQQAAFINDSQRALTLTLRPHGRLQVAFTGRAFPFDDRSLLQARYEHLGHLLVWPKNASYRVIPTGSLRALFNEGRPDVTPAVNLEPEPHAAGIVLGYPTRVWTFETPQGKLTLQQADVPEAELAAPLVCRFLVELLSIAPTTSACDAQRLPLRAEYEVEKGGRALFEVTKFDLASDTSGNVQVPPKDSQLRNFGLPPGRQLLAPLLLSSLRRGDKTGTLTVHNASAQLRYLLLDGVPVARVSPRTSETLSGISQGQYLTRLIDFWGTDNAPNNALTIGDSTTLGEPLEFDSEPEP